MFVNYLASLMFGYVLGSIPFGLLFTRLAGHGDIREIGSGNIGATNVLRTGNKALAAATLLADMGKGALAIFIVGYLLKEVPLALIFAGAGAFLGHIFPTWLAFKGGKGVAIYIGIMLALSPMVGAMMLLTWAFFAYALRISSLAALSMAAVTPFFTYVFGNPHMFFLSLFIGALIFYKHWANIKRLIDGSEPKIGENNV